MNKHTINKLKKLFGGCTIVGILIIIGSLLMDESTIKFKDNLPPILFSVMRITSDLLNIIGTTLVIGSIFDFVRNTKDFTDIIKESLMDVIQDKNFLQNLSEEEKKKDIFRIIGAKESEHTDIKKYINGSIDKVLNIYNKPYRINTIYNFTVKIVDSKLHFEGTINYSLRKNPNGYFNPIISIYDNEESKTVGIFVIVKGTRAELKVDINREKDKFIYETIIPYEFQKYDELEIEQHILDVYKGSQANFYARVVAPAYGFKLYLNCLDEELEIIDNFVFDDETQFDIVLDQLGKKITIKSIEWIDEWHGIVILIARRKK